MQLKWYVVSLTELHFVHVCVVNISADQFQEAMTPDEKSKLYDAIGYQEGQGDPTLPIEVNTPSSRVK